MHVVTRSADLPDAPDTAFVPTMGALHDGHLALIQRALDSGGPVVVSVFVNPTQFGEASDLASYPRRHDADLDACRQLGVEAVFAPSPEEVYPPDVDVPVPPLPAVATEPGLEDAFRPGHFAGVCQVVARLFDLVRPAMAVFGEKDYQQLLVIRALVAESSDRWPGLSIEACPTVRELDGLAESSRNVRLPAESRESALGLVRGLRVASRAETPADAEQAMRETLDEHGVEIEYAVVRDATTLMPIDTLARPARALVAARVGTMRLIDNKAVG